MWRAVPDTQDISNQLWWTESSHWCWMWGDPPCNHPAGQSRARGAGMTSTAADRKTCPTGTLPNYLRVCPRPGLRVIWNVSYSHGRMCGADCSVTQTECSPAHPARRRAWVNTCRRGQGPRESLWKEDCQRPRPPPQTTYEDEMPRSWELFS